MIGQDTIARILHLLRRHQVRGSRQVKLPEEPALAPLMSTIEQGIDGALGSLTLKTLALGPAPHAEAD